MKLLKLLRLESESARCYFHYILLVKISQSLVKLPEAGSTSQGKELYLCTKQNIRGVIYGHIWRQAPSLPTATVI